MSRRFKIPLGYWRSKGALVEPSRDIPHASRLLDGDAYECPACKGELKLAKGEKIPPYFAHNASGYTAQSAIVCSEETALHKIAKLLLVKTVNEWVAGGPSPQIERTCGRCRRKLMATPPEGTTRAVEEFTHEGRVHDVALLGAMGEPLLLLEVFVTHLTKPGIAGPWIELSGRAVADDPLLWEPMFHGNLEDVNCCDDCEREVTTGYQDVDPLNPHLFDIADEVFGPNGLLSKVMDGYENRPSQLEFAKAVDEAIKSSSALLVEGPCGVGKGAAYLAVSIAHALHAGGKALVSTTNKALQDQLYDKDVPQIAKVLGRDVDCALMRGRGNYVCQDRLRDWVADTGRGDDPIVSWATTSEDGDMGRAGFEIDPAIARKIRGDRNACGSACNSKKRGCNYQQAKRRAKKADVIITNHSQLFAHFVWRRRLGKSVVLPKASITICDEGHELADNARKHFETQLTEGQSSRIAYTVPRGAPLRKTASAAERERWNASERGRVARNRAEWQALFGADAKFFKRVKLAVTDRNPNIESAWVNGKARAAAEHYLEVIGQTISHWAGALDVAHALEDEIEIEAAEAGLEAAEDLATKLTAICEMSPDARTGTDRVYWTEAAGRERMRIKGCPVEVSSFIRDNLFLGQATVITSATLTSSGSFDMVKGELGFVGRELAVKSPFDFARQALLVLPTDQEMPVGPTGKDRRAFLRHAAHIFQLTAHYSGGGILFLFASRKSMHEVRQQIDRRFPFRILMQDEGNVSKRALVEQFKTDESSCMFGLRSFWAGLDVPGKALRCVVIEKLPFCVPSDPFKNYWLRKEGKQKAKEYDVQRAMIQVRQGVGRLIRQSSDRGVVVMLDRRIRAHGGYSDYSKHMQASVPWPHAWGIDSVRQFFAAQPVGAGAP